jgi:hypothetical protein
MTVVFTGKYLPILKNAILLSLIGGLSAWQFGAE